MTLRRFGISACTANPEDLPPSLVEHVSFWRSSTSSSLHFQDTPPPGSLRTRREGLPSPGSHRPTLGGRDELPVSEEPGLAPTNSAQPGPCPHGPAPQTVE